MSLTTALFLSYLIIVYVVVIKYVLSGKSPTAHLRTKKITFISILLTPFVVPFLFIYKIFKDPRT